MIQHFVNNIECVLPADFKFTLTEDNPEITNNGVFSLDVTLSMLERRNAIAFSHVNRLNTTHENKTLNAYFIINGRKIMGTDVISSESDVSITFQFVAGNSEIKYLSQNEKKIYLLDWGTETTIDLSRAIDSITNWSWRKNFICAPILAGGIVLNEYNLEFSSVTDDLIVMQPYLLYYINKLPELLGYTLKSNILENDERAQRMYLVNPISSLKYADCLPDMSIAEFVRAIEDFFNVTFLADTKDKSISIIRTIDDISTKNRVVLQPINGFETEEPDDDSGYKFGYTKISYTLPATTYFKYHHFSDELLAKFKVITIKFDGTYVFESKHINGYYIFRDQDTLRDYILLTLDYPSHPSIETTGWYQIINGVKCTFTEVNRFRDYNTDSTSTLDLKLCPASIDYFDKPGKIINSNGSILQPMPIPVSSNDFFIPDSANIIEVIEGSASEISRSTEIEVALYCGLYKLEKEVQYVGATPVYVGYPISFIDNVQETPTAYQSMTSPNDYTIYTMRLYGTDGVIANYRHTNIIDPTIVYKFIFPDSIDVNSNSLFYFEGNYYMPISFEREVEMNKKNVVTGKFYRMIKS